MYHLCRAAYIIILLHGTLFHPALSGTHSIDQTRETEVDLPHLRAAYALYSPDDYRPAINVYDYRSGKQIRGSMRGTTGYELAAMTLRYKHVMATPAKWYAWALTDDPKLGSLVPIHHLRYAKSDFLPEPIIYTPQGRHKALLLYRHLINVNMKHKRGMCGFHSDERIFEAYVMGVCFGYPLEDITFFFQRSTFHDVYRMWPEDSEDNRARFAQFLKHEWPQKHADRLTRVENAAQAWMDTYTSTAEVERELQRVQSAYPALHITYDQPFSQLLDLQCTTNDHIPE